MIIWGDSESSNISFNLPKTIAIWLETSASIMERDNGKNQEDFTAIK